VANISIGDCNVHSITTCSPLLLRRLATFWWMQDTNISSTWKLYEGGKEILLVCSVYEKIDEFGAY
jgi:hypothetical protein